MHNILVVIAARGGSKGVKGKNIRPLLGKPLIYYTIRQAQKWGKAKHIIVTTDSKEIKQEALKFGAQVPFDRDSNLAKDNSSKGDVIKDALLKCEKEYNERYDIVVDLDVTSPVRTVKDIECCYSLFIEKNPKTLFSVVRSHKNPYFNMVERGSDNCVRLCKSNGSMIASRQESPLVYDMNASIYFYDRDYLLSAKEPSAINDHMEIYEMNDISGIDIDREIDFKYIEFLVKEKVFQL